MSSDLTGQIIGAAIEVHKVLGPGLLESTYEECLADELNQRNISYRRQVEIPIIYKSRRLEAEYRADLIVVDQVLIELKSVATLEPIHKAQVITYLKLSNLRLALLINFNVPVLKQGIQRIVNQYNNET
ncbi:MAG: GxxExxY protein [Verrucomicrobiota bacterium]